GTGKSYLAVALGVQALQDKQVNRIILTRPAVEAGERLGFLPGDLMAKVAPYLRPLYDALHDMLEPEGAHRLLHRGPLALAPLRQRRRPSPRRPGHRRRLREGGRPALMPIDVFAADEQTAHPVDAPSLVQLARKVLSAEGLKGDVELSMLFVDEPAIADLNKR